MILQSCRTVVDEAHAELIGGKAPVAGLRKCFAGLERGDESFVPIGDVSAEGDRALPGDAGVQVSCTGLSGIGGPVVNKETGGTPATAIYVAYGYTYGETGQIIATAFIGDKYYQSTFQVHVVTKGINHDGAMARSVGVAALAGTMAVLLMV